MSVDDWLGNGEYETYGDLEARVAPSDDSNYITVDEAGVLSDTRSTALGVSHLAGEHYALVAIVAACVGAVLVMGRVFKTERV